MLIFTILAQRSEYCLIFNVREILLNILCDELSLDNEGTLDSNLMVSITLVLDFLHHKFCPNFDVGTSHKALYQVKLATFISTITHS